MIAFMTIIYVTAVLLVFKVFKVQPRPWPIAITATAGVLLLGTIIVLWTLAAPISSRCVVTRYVVQIVPQARGQVIRIPAKPNVPLKSGDVLYELDPTSFQADVDRARAQLQGAKSQVREARPAFASPKPTSRVLKRVSLRKRQILKLPWRSRKKTHRPLQS